MRGKILAIDDNPDSGKMMAWMLECAGHHVRVAKDGRNALEITQNYIPDVVISDIMMPGLNGYEVCMAMKANPDFSDVLFIAHTGWSSPQCKRLSQEVGFDYHLVKPVDPKVLLEIIDHSVNSNH